MGRIFEKRKYKMFARFDRMSKAFTRMGKEIAIAVKQGGPNPDTNPRLRVAIQNAKGVNMPKDRIEAAIKRASEKNSANLEEMVYEGYAPHGVAILAEATTDNTTRTVANVRMYFTRYNGTLGKTGSLDFLFERKGVFKFQKGNLNVEELEFELIDHGLEDLAVDNETGEVYIYTSFANFGAMSKALEDRKIAVISAEKQRIPANKVKLDETREEDVLKLVEALEQDDDVQQVYHNLA